MKKSRKGLVPQSVRIIVVDDHVLVRDLICAALSTQSSRYKVLAEVGSAADAVAVCKEVLPDLVILDIHLPDRNGIGAVADLKHVSPRSRILLCTGFASEDRILDAIRSGAEGFVEKLNSWNDFLDAVDHVTRGERYFRSTCASAISWTDHLQRGAEPKAALSPREKQVLALLAEGCTSKEIASRLYISVQTIETHRANLMDKFGVHNVAGLVMSAVKTGLVPLEPGRYQSAN